MTLITVIMFAFLTFFLPPYSPFDLHIEKKKHIYVCLRQDWVKAHWCPKDTGFKM